MEGASSPDFPRPPIVSEIEQAPAQLPEGQPVGRVIAMPADTNPEGDIFGGWLLAQMDLAGATPAFERADDPERFEGLCRARLKAAGAGGLLAIGGAIWTVMQVVGIAMASAG